MENVQNVILVVHLVLAFLLIGVVLLQRSEGGGLGMGGGGGGGVMTGRQAANALTKLTWVFAIGFLTTSITLTVLSARAGKEASVIDTTTATAPAAPETTAPPAATDEPVVPPVTPPAATETPAPAEAPAQPETPAPSSNMPALPGGVSPYSQAPASN